MINAGFLDFTTQISNDGTNSVLDIRETSRINCVLDVEI